MLVALGSAALVSACGGPPDDPAPVAPSAVALVRLRQLETSRRAATDFRTAGADDGAFGPDPVAIARVPGRDLAVGVLRGASAVVLLDADARERARADAPRSPTSVAIGPSGDVFVGGELASEIARYELADGAFRVMRPVRVAGVRAIRGLATGVEGVLYVVEEHDHRLLTIALDSGAVLDASEPPMCLGPVSLLRTPRWLVVDCVLSHEVVALPVDAHGVPRRAESIRIKHEGPVWGVDAVEAGDALWIAMGGVEDHPLDRRQGSFGYIDSFAWVYRVAGGPPAAERLAIVNTSALDVVTPKLVRLNVDGASIGVRVTGYGSKTGADLVWRDPRPNRKGVWPRPAITTRSLVPGIVAEAAIGGRRLLADPLLDAWIVDDGSAARIVPVEERAPAPRRDVDARVGEALFFTTLMAPWNRTKGSLSRFTCETCHFEGYVDGRVHDTGREDVHVTTRPLHGLFNDAPYFSRALDPDLTAMVHNEFRVAGRRSRHDPWFTLRSADVPWLAQLGVDAEPLSPEALRRSLMAFFMALAHRPNPSTLGRSAWSSEERRGAEVFRNRCEACHQARLVADRPDSRVPFDQWEALVMSPAAPIVWARDTYEKTGIEPYVHPSGSRVPSLRRLYKKQPYFTNGSAADLGDLVARARTGMGGFSHGGGDDPTGPAMDAESRAALCAFLDLL